MKKDRDTLKREILEQEKKLDKWIFLSAYLLLALAFYSQTGYHVYPRGRSDIAGLEEAKAEMFYKTVYIFGSYLIAAVVYLGLYLLFRAKNSDVQRISLRVMKNDTVVLDIIFIGIFALTAILLLWIARGMIRILL